MAVELATAYVSLVPSAKGMRQRIAQELDIDVPAEKSGRSAGRRLAGALGSTLKKTAIGVGAVAGAALSASLVKGFGRLTAIEEAQAKLTGLGHSAESVRTIMDNALGAVRGTAFGLDEAATTAASAVAAGIKPGKDLRRVLGLVADTASIAGSSMGEMGAIFNKVAAANRLTMAEVNQLSDRGVPIMQMLAEQFGVTASEAAKMVSQGKVTFADFAQALETNVAGAALSSGDTTRGAFANMMAAAGRFGASLLEGVFPVTKKVFGAVITGLDTATEKLRPFVETASTWILTRVVPAAETLMAKLGELGPKIGEVVARVREFFSSDAGQQLKEDTFTKLQSTFEKLATAARDLAPSIVIIAGSLATASGAVGVSTWQLLLATLEALSSVLLAVVPAVQSLAEWMRDNQSTVTALVVAYAGWRVASLGITAALKVKAGWVAVNKARIAALTKAKKAAAVASRVWAAAINAARYAQIAGYLAVLRVRTLAVSAATKVAAVSQRLFNAAMVAGRWTVAIAQLVAYRVATLAVAAATKVWTGIQWLFNAAMSANPIGLVVVAIAALVAGIVLAYKRSETFRNIVQTAFRAIGAAATWLWENAIKPAWDGIKKAFDVVAGAVEWWWKNVTVPAFNAVAAGARWLFDQVKRSFSFWKGVFDQVRAWASQARDWIVSRFNSVVDFVRGLPGRISSAARGMWDGIRNAFRAAINWIIDKWNNLSFTLPGVNIPGLGKVGGFTLNTPNIPRLAQGGIVPATPGGRIVRVAEAGQAEAVIPLDRLERMVGPQVLELHLDLGEGIREVVRINLREHDRQLRRRVGAGAVFA